MLLLPGTREGPAVSSPLTSAPVRMSHTASLLTAVSLLVASAQATLITLDPDNDASPHTHSLSCASESPWFFCVWESPQGARLCSVQSRETGAVTSSECGEAEGRLGLAGNTTECRVTIQRLQIEDSGQWTCALTDNNMDTVKQHRELEIQVPGTLGLTALGGEIRLEEGELEGLDMMAGERLEMVCRLEETWPVTNLTWSVTRDGADVMEGVDIRLGETVTTGECDLCPVTLEQRAEVSLSSWDTGLEVRCHSQEREAGVRLVIRPLVTADTGHLRDISARLGLVPGVVISAVLILLSLAILVSFCIRGSRRRKGSAVNTEAEDPEAGGCLVEADIIKNKDGVEDIIDDIYEDKNKDNESSIESSSDANTSSDNSSDTNSSK